MITKIEFQFLEHGIQWELPKDRLRLLRQRPHKIPERPLAHCAFIPSGVFKLISTVEVGGRQ